MLAPRPGLRAGFRSIPRSLIFLISRPRLWPICAVPALLLSLFGLGFVAVAFLWILPLVESWLPTQGPWYSRLGSHAASWLAAIVASLVGFLITLVITPPLSGPALEAIVRAREQDLDIAERTPIGFFAEIFYGLKAQFVALLCGAPFLILLWLIELFFPPAAVVTLPLSFLIGAMIISWNLFDYPLTLRGIGMRDRLLLLRRNSRAALGFGAGLTILFWIPCASILLLPVGVAAATELVWNILASDSTLLPNLPRRSTTLRGAAQVIQQQSPIGDAD